MNHDDSRLRLIKRLALICAGLLLATTVLSAYMRLSLAGLGCADWPACYAAALRTATDGANSAAAAVSEPAVVVARLAHRVVASLALVLIATMVMMAWKHPGVTRPQRALAVALLALALGLSALGIVTPGARTPAIPIGNVIGGFLMLALCWRLHASIRTGPAHTPIHGLGPWAAAGLVILAAQLASGALLSTSYASLSCASLSQCLDLAREAGWNWSTLNPWREPVFEASAPHINVDGALGQWVHRLGSIVGAAALLVIGVLALRKGRVRAGASLLALTAIQVLLGLFALSGADLPLWAAQMHNLVAGLLLVVLLSLV